MSTPSCIEKHIADHQGTAVLLLDSNCRLHYANSAAENLLGITEKRLLGRHAKDVLNMPEGNKTACLSKVQESLSPYAEHAIPLSLADGRRLTVDCLITPIVDTGSKTAQDYIVELRILDHQLRVNRESQLLAQQVAVHDMLRGLAHEIKNPLGGIRGAAQLLESELESEEQREYTQVVINEVDRLKNLVDRMLGSNRLPQEMPTNIHKVLERVCTLAQSDSRYNIHIKKDYDPSIPELLGDEEQLIQAILNIVSNAMRAADRQLVLRTRVLRHFTLGETLHPLVACIEIQDDGSGVAEELRDTLFYPMVTASEDGSGLGLSIAQNIINRHNGLIEYRSKPGETVFIVLLPVEPSI